MPARLEDQPDKVHGVLFSAFDEAGMDGMTASAA
jgi:hypothetical protein